MRNLENCDGDWIMKRGCGVVLRLLGLLLLTGAALKGYQLLTEPLADADLWSNRHFLIFVVEFELALSLWLLSGLYKKAAWLAATGCFLVFSCVTLYKGLTGAASCGCFGTVHVNPWITLFCIDLPALAALIAFRPGGLNLRRPLAMLTPHPRLIHLTAVWLITLSLVTTSTAVLALNEPALVTAKYEVLEPAEWVGKELPILAHIDIKDQLSQGNWLVLLYHYDCPGCGEAIPQYEQIARDLKGNEEFLQIAFVAVPPFGQAPITETAAVTLGKMDNSKEWFVTTGPHPRHDNTIRGQSHGKEYAEAVVNNTLTWPPYGRRRR
jgi:hypothetical protein